MKTTETKNKSSIFKLWAVNKQGDNIYTNEKYSVLESCLTTAIEWEENTSNESNKMEFTKEKMTLNSVIKDEPIDFKGSVNQYVYTSLNIVSK